MALVILIEQEDGRLGWYKPSSQQYEVTGETEVEFLTRLESEYTAQGVIVRGIMDELDIPEPPDGGSISDLIWEEEVPAYDTVRITNRNRTNLIDQVSALFFEKEASIQITVDSVLFNDGDRMKQNLGLLAGVVANGGVIPAGAKIRQADGVRVSLTTQLHLDLSNALATAHSDLLNALEDHLDAIAAANDAALDVYDVNVGWP